MGKVPKSAEFSLDLSCPGYDLHDDEWRLTGPAYIECWRGLSESASTHTYEAFGARYSLKFDWSPMESLIRRMHQAHERLYRAYDEGKDPSKFARFPRKPARIKIQSKASKVPKYEHRHSSLVVTRLHDVFLIANLSAPGAGNLYRASLRNSASSDKADSDSLYVSGFYFGLALIDTHQGKWPTVKTLPVQTVVDWFDSVRSGYAQVPQNHAEKVIFALLHLATLDMSPVAVIWIFYALETLFDTRTGENLRILCQRIELLLQPDSKQREFLRKEMRELYNIRSALVHGGFPLHHPMMDDALDKRLDQVYAKWMGPTEFGFRVLCASLQSIIERHIRWPKFSEVICDAENAL